GERGGHSTQPPYPMTCSWNVPRMFCWTLDTLCGGAQAIKSLLYESSDSLLIDGSYQKPFV
ncbi:hypothetical protein AVEN_206330-1, partial [Araneus ventricosus]